MEKPIENYWKTRMTDLKEVLDANNFETFIVENTDEAKSIVLEKIIPEIAPKSVSWGGSLTFVATGLYDVLKNNNDLNILDTYDKTLSPEESLERRRQSLLVDLFITGSNAVTETGQLVNLDMIGNRVGALTFGPKNVIILVGRNKIVPDLDEAMWSTPCDLTKKHPVPKHPFVGIVKARIVYATPGQLQRSHFRKEG